VVFLVQTGFNKALVRKGLNANMCQNEQ